METKQKKEIKVMLVDDEPDFTQPMAFWLTSKGYAVVEVGDGKEALKKIKEEKPDIVFLDINMPVMDGITTLKEIRQFDKDIPVIFISAYVSDPRVQEASGFGISGVFYKGSDFNEGLTLLETVLRTHKHLKNK